MQQAQRRFPTDLKAIGLLFVITLLIFSYTVHIRRPWFGQLSPLHHQWVTGSAVKFSRIWQTEGAWKLRFTMIENPASPEFPTVFSREPYPSYPSGLVFPIYIISQILHTPTTPAIAMSYNLAIQFLVAFMLALIVFTIMRHYTKNVLIATGLAIVPILTELLLPAPLYFHQNVYFSDEAVLLPFTALLLTEAFDWDQVNEKQRRSLGYLQDILLFWGFFTDWLFFFVAIILYLKRLIEGRIPLKPFIHLLKHSLRFWLAPLLASALFLYQVNYVHGFGLLINKYYIRTGISGPVPNFYDTFWHSYIHAGFGAAGEGLIWLSLVSLIALVVGLLVLYYKRQSAVYKRVKNLTLFMALVLVPCFMEVYFFANHSTVHDFPTLKFVLPLALLPFVVIPLTVCLVLQGDKSKNRSVVLSPWAAFVLSVIATAYVLSVFPMYKVMFPAPDPSYAVIGASINQATTQNDVVFSPDIAIPAYPPQMLAYSLKRVYPVTSPADLKAQIAQIPKRNYSVVLLFLSPPGPAWNALLGGAKSTPFHGYYYFSLSPDQLLN